jgi:putative colanic acid biosynthesis UDP-glucose lipid carrier transferase
MHVEADAERQAQERDRRVFSSGRWLRRTSLDEVPQFWNVLTGDMSVVGPRPHLESQEDIFRRSAEVYRMRFFVKPGITGLAQAHGLRGEARDSGEIERRIRADVTYIRSWSVWLDLAIIARTVGQILRPPRSAY